MIDNSFLRDFFHMPPKAARYEWTVTERRPYLTDSMYAHAPKPLFEDWQEKGWEVVSVTVFASTVDIQMCRAVAVLRRPKP